MESASILYTFCLILSFPIAGFIGYKIQVGKKWARSALSIYLIIYFVLILVYILSGFNQYQTYEKILTILVQILHFGLQVYALILLYSKDSKDWYNNILHE